MPSNDDEATIASTTRIVVSPWLTHSADTIIFDGISALVG